MGRETNKSRRDASAASAREKAAAARAVQAQADRRRRAIVILSSVVALVLVIVVIAAVALNSSSNKNGGSGTPANAQVVSQLTNVPASTTAAVGKGSSDLSVGSISDPPLTSGGKPEFLYIGAEFCPFCAAERWSMIQALSRFGTFSNLHEIYSAEDHIPTFTFVGSSYSSKYLVFTPREIENNESPDPKQLQKLTAAQEALFLKHSPKGEFPYLYLAGKYAQNGAGYDPGVLEGKTQTQVASALTDTSAATTKGILGQANVLTAAICGITNNKPANVCSSSMISGFQSQIQPYQAPSS